MTEILQVQRKVELRHRLLKVMLASTMLGKKRKICAFRLVSRLKAIASAIPVLNVLATTHIIHRSSMLSAIKAQSRSKTIKGANEIVKHARRTWISKRRRVSSSLTPSAVSTAEKRNIYLQLLLRFLRTPIRTEACRTGGM
jgi:hypothetical protein